MSARSSQRLLGLVLGLATLAATRPAAAQLEFAGDAPRIFSIQEREYRLRHEFQLGVGVLPLDAFYIGAVAAAGYTFHFSDIWAWEIANAAYSYNFDTGLEDELLDEYGAQAALDELDKVRVLFSTSIVAKPMFGKVAIFNKTLLRLETAFSAGMGPALTTDGTRFALNGGAGFRFWAHRAFSVRFDVRDYLVFDGFTPKNVLLIMLSGSVNYNSSYYDTAASEAESWSP